MAIKGAKQKRNNWSPEFKELMEAAEGVVVNLCPYGCEEEHLQEHGYCQHLIGFTVPGKPKEMEPFSTWTNAYGVKDRRFTDGTRRCPVPEGSKLIQLSVNHRVYHELGELALETHAKALVKAD